MFEKYVSIENHYNSKNLDRWERGPFGAELLLGEFEVTEKLHGANFTVIVNKDRSVNFARRTSVLAEDEKFYGYHEVFALPQYKHLIEVLRTIVSTFTIEEVQLVGELFGSNIQKGVFYGEDKQFRWFALKFNGEYLSPKEADQALLEVAHLKVPTIGTVKCSYSLRDMIDSIDTEFNSLLTPDYYTESNICEGVVIKPYDFVAKENGGGYFLIKKKNSQFMEKQKVSRPKPNVVLSEELQGIVDLALEYVNPQRTANLFSKEGPIEEAKELSAYAKKYNADFFEDFMKDHKDKFTPLAKTDQKVITKAVGQAIFAELKKALAEG